MKNALIVLLYSQNEEAKAANKYEEIIQDNKFDIDNCSVIVRNNNQKNKILGYRQKKYNLLETYAMAVELLNTYSNIDDYHEGILYLAKAIQITFFNDDAHRNKTYFYCPEAVEFIDWRVSLGKICKSLLQNKKLKNWNMTWKEFKVQLMEDIKYLKNHVEILKDRDIEREKRCYKDYADFRRLMHKTQIFNANKGDYFRNGLTHTLGVNQIARLIGKALGHDMGHASFGYEGEKALHYLISGQIDEIDLPLLVKGFKHNFQSVHLLENLEKSSYVYTKGRFICVVLNAEMI